MTDGALPIVMKPVSVAIGQTRDLGRVSASLQRPEQLAKSDFPFAANDEIDARVTHVCLRSEARIVTSDHHANARPQFTDELDDAHCRASLKCHDRQPNNVRLQFPHEPLDGLAYAALNQDQISDRRPVVRIDISRKRSECTIRHPDDDLRHVLKRIRHRKKEDLHVERRK